ncbi:hypothetical protein AB0K15_41095 [Amycolatopsis sp. NPDC049253]|uniref:hypothetical protein n=1 Tax=Amycolatopsis sp. NPDC049253 TaxID=3155274 RepID=UPI003427E327
MPETIPGGHLMDTRAGDFPINAGEYLHAQAENRRLFAAISISLNTRPAPARSPYDHNPGLDRDSTRRSRLDGDCCRRHGEMPDGLVGDGQAVCDRDGEGARDAGQGPCDRHRRGDRQALRRG